jgi:hypothetical protein
MIVHASLSALRDRHALSHTLIQAAKTPSVLVLAYGAAKWAADALAPGNARRR